MIRDIALRGFKRTMDPAADELALCRRIAAGERHLFARVVDQYTPLVAGALTAQGVGPAEIDDLAQLAFINVYKGLGGFRGEARLSSWIYRIALNVARAHLKRSGTRPQTESVELAMETGHVPVDERPDSGRDWEGRRMLEAAMLRLPATQRTALALFYFEELSYEEISAALRLNLNTVRTHIRRGKQGLAELLDSSLLDN